MLHDAEPGRYAEMSVIGAIIIDETSLAKVIDKIIIEDFSYSDLREIYKSILDLSNSGKVIDFITVLNDLSSKNFLTRNELKKLLLTCCESTLSVSNIEGYADIIHKSALARSLEESLLSALSDGIASENVVEQGENLIERLSQIISPIQNGKMRGLNEISQNLIDYYSGKVQKIENRCDTGYSKIDSFLKGMSGGNLIILASRPKVGKTAFSLSIAQNVAETGKKMVFYSQEMLGSELCERILSKESGISMDKLIDNTLLPDEIEKLQTTLSNMKNNLIINDSAGITVQDIRLNCRMIKDLGLIIIDYLQLMKSNSRHDTRNQEIGAISRELKKLATDLNVPILCLSQLNRVSNENTRPTSSELRDSGELEQNCNKLMLMWCVKKHGNLKTVGVDVALNRRGGNGVTLLDFCGENMNFTELKEDYQEDNKSNFDWRNKIYKK
ncbi:MAG: replicative DNA helicase [Acutalibacteraceae bacterium]